MVEVLNVVEIDLDPLAAELFRRWADIGQNQRFDRGQAIARFLEWLTLMRSMGL
jgi:hypothetical protein